MSTFIPALPGILATSADQHYPLGLDRYDGEPVWIDYGDEKGNFNMITEAKRVAKLIHDHENKGDTLKIVGSSIGAMVLAFAAMYYEEEYGQPIPQKHLLILHEPPAGSKSFQPVAFVPEKLMASKITYWLILRWAGRPFLWLNRTFMGLPKPDEIIIPPDKVSRQRLLDREDVTNVSTGEWNAMVKDRAKTSLTGHSPKVWAQQIHAMSRLFYDGSQAKAAKALRGLNVVLISGTYGNLLVQPMSNDWWIEVAEIDDSRVIWLEVVHCGYLQMLSIYKPVFNELLR